MITITYGQKPLTMLQTDPVQTDLWANHPIKLSEEEARELNLDQLVSILANESRPPSQFAGIPMGAIASNWIQRLDRAYHDAMEEYQRSLKEAQTKDLTSIREHKDLWIYENCPGFAWALQIFGASFIGRDQYDRDTRLHRFTWLRNVSVLEGQRVFKMKNEIETALTYLVEDLENLAKHNQTDAGLLKEIKQLKKVYKAHFPKASLPQGGIIDRLFPHGRKEFLLKFVRNLAGLIHPPKYSVEKSAKWLCHLALSDETQHLPIGTDEEIFRCLKSMHLHPKANLELRSLLEQMITNRKGALVCSYSADYLKNFLCVLLDVYEYCEAKSVTYFCCAPGLRDAPSLDEIIYSLQSIKAWYQSRVRLAELDNLLFAFYRNQMEFTKLFTTLTTQAPACQMRALDSPDVLRTLYRRFAGEIDDPNVVFPLSTEILENVSKQYDVVQNYCSNWESLDPRELRNLVKEISAKDEKNLDDTLQLVAIGRLAILQEFHIYLYNTQIWAVLAQLNHLNRSIAQMITGEGKSKVAALLAFVLAIKNPSQGHVVSSNRSLSIRDQMEHDHFFKAFGIETAHICEDNRPAGCFQARVLYGTATDFEFALMRQMLYFEKLFPPNAFDWIIVDEVDNLTIDTALSGARLSYSAEITYDWVYEPIFSFVQARFPFHFVSSNLLEDLRRSLKGFAGGKFSDYVDCFSDRKLKSWIHSACIALQHKEKEHYIIGLQNSAYGKKTKRVLIVDAENTGRIQYGSRWSGGVHEFVEVKHNLQVARENLCPISMSHPVFYPMYKSLFGITGTVGSLVEREELKAIYDIDSFDVPTHLPSQRNDAPVTVLATNAECSAYYIQTIRRCQDAGRPILILCFSIEQSEILGKRLEEEGISFQLLNEIQIQPEEAIIARAGFPGAVTIATNTAGRGTDIKLPQESIRNGGLHVLITFYPDSDRIERQARGRAGRQGQPGSSEIVISGESLDTDLKEVLPYLSDLRKQRAVNQKDAHIAYAKIECCAFKMVQEFYQMLRTFHQSVDQDLFLSTLTTFLNHRKFLKPEKRDLSSLSEKNRKIAEKVLQLLHSPEDSIREWKVVIKQIAERVKDFVIHDFALNFYPLISEIIQDSDVIPDLNIANRLQEQKKKKAQDASNRLEEALQVFSSIKLQLIQGELQEAFTELKQRWKEYLDLSGLGVLKYLKEQLNINLILRKSERFPREQVAAAHG